jgi:hypothetical protein
LTRTYLEKGLTATRSLKSVVRDNEAYCGIDPTMSRFICCFVFLSRLIDNALANSHER